MRMPLAKYAMLPRTTMRMMARWARDCTSIPRYALPVLLV